MYCTPKPPEGAPKRARPALWAWMTLAESMRPPTDPADRPAWLRRLTAILDADPPHTDPVDLQTARRVIIDLALLPNPRGARR